MKLAEDIWLSSVTARNNLLAASNYTAAFYGNAALQSWSFGLTAPQVFWSAMARAVDRAAVGNVVAEPAPAVETPKLSVVKAETAQAPVETPVETEAAPAPSQEAPAVEVEADPSPLLLDAPRGGVADDLKLVKGIGAKMEASLNEFGIYHFDQIAGLDSDGIDWLDQHLPGFKRNCARFDLVSGARALL